MNSIQPTILIVDDEKHTRDGLRRLLEDEHDVYVAADIAGAVNVLEREQIDVLLTDLRLGGEDGMTLIDRALKMPRAPVCIMMTAYGSIDVAVEAMKRGAYDFVTKPLNLDKVELLIARAVQGRKLEQENRALRQQVDERYGLENIWGESAALHQVLDTIRQVAPSSASVLIEGESGTGKELAAQAIHNLSRRNKAKFVAADCGHKQESRTTRARGKVSGRSFLSPERCAHHHAAIARSQGRYSDSGPRIFTAFLQSERKTSSRSSARRHGCASHLQLAWQRSRAAHRDRARGGDGDRTEDHTPGSSDGGATSRQSDVPPRNFRRGGFRGKIESARSARNGKKIDHASAGRDQWQCHRSSQKARH